MSLGGCDHGAAQQAEPGGGAAEAGRPDDPHPAAQGRGLQRHGREPRRGLAGPQQDPRGEEALAGLEFYLPGSLPGKTYRPPCMMYVLICNFHAEFQE